MKQASQRHQSRGNSIAGAPIMIRQKHWCRGGVLGDKTGQEEL